MTEYTLNNAEDRNRENPDTFWIPAKHRREYLKTGAIVKLIFDGKERMWVTVTERTKTGYEGTLSSIPADLQTAGKLRYGDVVEFGPEHVIDIFAPENIDRPRNQKVNDDMVIWLNSVIHLDKPRQG